MWEKVYPDRHSAFCSYFEYTYKLLFCPVIPVPAAVICPCPVAGGEYFLVQSSAALPLMPKTFEQMDSVA